MVVLVLECRLLFHIHVLFSTCVAYAEAGLLVLMYLRARLLGTYLFSVDRVVWARVFLLPPLPKKNLSRVVEWER